MIDKEQNLGTIDKERAFIIIVAVFETLRNATKCCKGQHFSIEGTLVLDSMKE